MSERLTPEERAAILQHPKVQAGLRDYFDRYKRHGGNIPTVSAEEALRLLDDLDRR